MKKMNPRSMGVLAGLTAIALTMFSVAGCGNASDDNVQAEPTAVAENNTATEPTKAEPTPEATPVPTVSTPEYKYVMMNIPYADFYGAEISGNNVEVDAVASATMNKTRSGGMMSGGSYHQSADGSDISGVLFPVAVASDVDLSSFTQLTDEASVSIEVTNRGQTTSTTYTGKDALFESSNYSYYVLSEAPEYFKYLTMENGKLTFSKVTGMKTTTLTDVSGALQTSTSYGDFQLNLTDTGIDTLEPTIYGVIIHTKEGSDFGLRHLENIWRYTQLAWCTGFTTSVHNCPTSSDHYKSMMGKTITGFTFYTNNGCFEITLKDSAYVPYKFENTFSVSSADINSGSAAIEATGFPAEYKKTYSVCDKLGNPVEAFSFNNDSITWSNNVLPGSYTLSIVDGNNVYSDYKTQFTLSTDSAAAVFDSASFKMVAADNVSAEAFTNHLGNITTVTIDEVKYSASGRGAVEIINPENGSIDFEATPFTIAPKDATTGYSVTVKATGYPDYSFNIKISVE